MAENVDMITGTAAVGHHIMARLDWTSAGLIEEGIKLQHVHGTRHAADFLKDRMIDIDVALRVLLDPARRRSGVNS